MRYNLLCFFTAVCFSSVIYSQQLFHQAIFHGGVTAAGWSSGVGAWGDGNIDIHIEPGSTIKHAWLFIYSFGDPPQNYFEFNNTPIYHKDLTPLETVSHFLDILNPVRFYVYDVAELISPAQTTYPVALLSNNSTGPEVNWGWWCPTIYVEYEHPDLDKITTALWRNDQHFTGTENYSFQLLNPFITSSPVGFSMMTDRICNHTTGGSTVFFNGLNIGSMGGNNTNSFNPCSGTKGHFYYHNAELFPLDTSQPNATVGEGDALVNIASYLVGNPTSHNLRLQINQSNRINIYQIFTHAYTTPCDTFSTAISADTTVCKESSLTLTASGGTNYEWLGAGVTDPTQPSITVNADSSHVYVVRIENTPGCYTTESVHVHVLDQPVIQDVSITPSVCGESNGSVLVTAEGLVPLSYSLDELTQTSPNFTNLAGGEYLLAITDQNGCITDQLVTVDDNITVQAEFIAIPPEGSKPLSVNFDNTSANATDYEWFIEDEFFTTDFNPGTIFEENGTYTVTLIAYNKQPHCADTFSLTILVRDTITAIIPNVFTPNNDGVNDLFTLKVKGALSLEAHILNRWGNELYRTSADLDPENLTTITIWDGRTFSGDFATEGVYFYKIAFINLEGQPEIFNGFFHLNR